MKEAKKPAAKKAAPKVKKVTEKIETATAPAEKAPSKPTAAAAKKSNVSPEQRYKMIQDAAYFITERHGFNGDSAYFWSLAEAEVNSRLT
jgi:hypothetical protein